MAENKKAAKAVINNNADSAIVNNAPEILPENIILNQIVIRPIDRSTKDIGTWRYSHKAAESPTHPNRTRLYDVYADCRLDGHLTGVIDKRFDAVLNKKWRYEVSGKKIDEMDARLIKKQVFRDTICELLESKIEGISGMEFIPGEEVTMNVIPRKHIKPDIKIIAFEQSGETGYKYEEIENVWVVGKRHDLGLLLKCAPYALYKRGNMADWAQYVEIFGQPVRVIKYDAFDEKTKKELKTIVDEAGSSLAMVIPKQAEFEMMDGKMSNGDGQLQERFKKACDDEMSVIILGNTETTTSSKSSGYAQSETHSKQQHEVTKSDLSFIGNLLNSKKFFEICKSYGLPVVEGGEFVTERELDLEELKSRKDIDSFVSQKVPVGDDYYYDAYGIPKPDNYDELKTKMEEERQMKMGFNSDEPNGNHPPKPKNKVPSLSAWNKLRHVLADFFDQAPLQ